MIHMTEGSSLYINKDFWITSTHKLEGGHLNFYILPLQFSNYNEES